MEAANDTDSLHNNNNAEMDDEIRYTPIDDDDGRADTTMSRMSFTSMSQYSASRQASRASGATSNLSHTEFEDDRFAAKDTLGNTPMGPAIDSSKLPHVGISGTLEEIIAMSDKSSEQKQRAKKSEKETKEEKKRKPSMVGVGEGSIRTRPSTGGRGRDSRLHKINESRAETQSPKSTTVANDEEKAKENGVRTPPASPTETDASTKRQQFVEEHASQRTIDNEHSNNQQRDTSKSIELQDGNHLLGNEAKHSAAKTSNVYKTTPAEGTIKLNTPSLTGNKRTSQGLLPLAISSPIDERETRPLKGTKSPEFSEHTTDNRPGMMRQQSLQTPQTTTSERASLNAVHIDSVDNSSVPALHSTPSVPQTAEQAQADVKQIMQAQQLQREKEAVDRVADNLSRHVRLLEKAVPLPPICNDDDDDDDLHHIDTQTIIADDEFEDDITMTPKTTRQNSDEKPQPDEIDENAEMTGQTSERPSKSDSVNAPANQGWRRRLCEHPEPCQCYLVHNNWPAKSHACIIQ